MPVVVLIHGGGWRGGNRQRYLDRAIEFVATGRYAAATIGYRLSGEAVWPAQLHDWKAAVRWLTAHAEQPRRLHRRLTDAGVSSSLVIIPGSGHGLRGIDGLFERELKFLDEQFWPNRSEDSSSKGF